MRILLLAAILLLQGCAGLDRAGIVSEVAVDQPIHLRGYAQAATAYVTSVDAVIELRDNLQIHPDTYEKVYDKLIKIGSFLLSWDATQDPALLDGLQRETNSLIDQVEADVGIDGGLSGKVQETQNRLILQAPAAVAPLPLPGPNQ